MASPVIDGVAVGVGGGTAATTHAVAFPAAGVPDGALILVFGRVAAGDAAVSLPAGWTVSYDFSDASDDTSFWAYRNALVAGSPGSSVTVTHASAKMPSCSIVLTGTADPATRAPEASAYAVGSSVSPNSPAVTPTGGSKDYLFLTMCGTPGTATETADPAGYSLVTRPSASGGGAATQAIIMVASKAATASTEDPGSWTIPTNTWTAWTVAVHPLGAGGSTFTKAGYAKESA